MRARRSWVVVLIAGLLVGACGGSADEPAVGVNTTSGASETTTTAGPVETTSATPTASSSIRDMRTDLGIAEVKLHPADEGGPHPTLGWDPVDGAATYWLVLRDSGGIYWAWTGAETSVRVGGGDSDEINQTAALHEPMTWAVSAFDGSGTLIALSDVAEVTP